MGILRPYGYNPNIDDLLIPQGGDRETIEQNVLRILNTRLQIYDNFLFQQHFLQIILYYLLFYVPLRK